MLVPYGTLSEWGIVCENGTDPGDLPPRKIRAVIQTLCKGFLPGPLVEFGIVVSRHTFQPLGDLFLRFLPPAAPEVLGVKYVRSSEPPQVLQSFWESLPCDPMSPLSLRRLLRKNRIRKSISSLLGSRVVSIFRGQDSRWETDPGWREGQGFFVSWARTIPSALLRASSESQVLVVFPTTLHIEEFLGRPVDVPVYRHDSAIGVKSQRASYFAARSGEPGLHLAVQNGPFLPLPRLSQIVVMDEPNPAYVTRDRLPLDIREACLIRARTQKIPLVSISYVPRLYLTLTNGLPRKFSKEMLSLPQPAVFSFRTDGRRSPHFTRPLIERLNAHWNKNEKVVLLATARGEGYLVCARCGALAACPVCHRTLYWSEDRTRIVCGACREDTFRRPDKCVECGDSSFRTRGVTAGRIQRELQHLAPDVPTKVVPPLTRNRLSALRNLLEQFASKQGPANLIVTPEILHSDLSKFPVRVVLRADSFWWGSEERPPEYGVDLIARFLNRAPFAYLQVDGTGFSAVTAFTEGNLAVFLEDERRTREILGSPPFRAVLEIYVRARTENAGERTLREWLAYAGGAAAVQSEITGPVLGGRSRFSLEYVWWLRTPSAEELYRIYSPEAIDFALRKGVIRWRVTYR